MPLRSERIVGAATKTTSRTSFHQDTVLRGWSPYPSFKLKLNLIQVSLFPFIKTTILCKPYSTCLVALAYIVDDNGFEHCPLKICCFKNLKSDVEG